MGVIFGVVDTQYGKVFIGDTLILRRSKSISREKRNLVTVSYKLFAHFFWCCFVYFSFTSLTLFYSDWFLATFDNFSLDWFLTIFVQFKVYNLICYFLNKNLFCFFRKLCVDLKEKRILNLVTVGYPGDDITNVLARSAITRRPSSQQQ